MGSPPPPPPYKTNIFKDSLMCHLFKMTSSTCDIKKDTFQISPTIDRCNLLNVQWHIFQINYFLHKKVVVLMYKYLSTSALCFCLMHFYLYTSDELHVGLFQLICLYSLSIYCIVHLTPLSHVIKVYCIQILKRYICIF